MGQKRAELDRSYEEYRKACEVTDLQIRVRKQIREQVYEKLCSGTATMEDVLRLPTQDEDLYAEERAKGEQFDKVGQEYAKCASVA